jgi:hypothetical protein
MKKERRLSKSDPTESEAPLDVTQQIVHHGKSMPDLMEPQMGLLVEETKEEEEPEEIDEM